MNTPQDMARRDLEGVKKHRTVSPENEEKLLQALIKMYENYPNVTDTAEVNEIIESCPIKLE